MIISGGSRSNWRFFSKHLLKAEDNERVSVTDMRGLLADDVPEAFREMDAVASGTRCKNFFYHANINPREGETLTPEQWQQAVDTLERNLGLEGHARFVVEHEKNGRTHCHVVWSRVDPDRMKAVSDSFTAPIHERTSRELEQAFGLQPVESVLTKDREAERPERGLKNWETYRGHTSGIDPQQVKAEVTALWNASDSGASFAAALEHQGYILCRGDKRDFCIIDHAGDDHSLARRIQGAKAAEIRTRMSGIDADALPSVAEGRELAAQRHQAAQEQPQQAPLTGMEAFTAGMANVMTDEAAATQSARDELTEITQSAPSGSSAFAAYAAAAENAMQADTDDLDMHDGLTWWERAAVVLHDARERVTTWARDHWQSAVAKWSPDREGNGPHPEPDSGPDMGR
jgi:hypothetical protein